MRDSEFRQRLAQLQAMIAIQNAQLMANPKPHLEEMVERCHEILKVLEDVEYALSPDMAFDYWLDKANKEQMPNPTDFQGEALVRCDAALDVIRKYKLRGARKAP